MADGVPISLYPSGGLYLKSISDITIEVRLPEIRNPGVTVSNWEIMEKIKEKSQPEEYQSLRVTVSARELIKFTGELESVKALRKVVLLLNAKTIKLRGFPDPLKIRAYQSTTEQSTKQQWELFFQERGMESFESEKPGERPDTVHIKGLPVRWFTSKDSEGGPCPKVLTSSFEKFGKVRQVGFYDPSMDTCQKGFSSFGPGAATQVLYFEAYIQYEKYNGFCNAMEGLKDMQLMRLQSGGQSLSKITVDFDKTGFLSERSIRKRIHLEEKRKLEVEMEKRRKEENEREEEKRKEEKEREEELKRQRKLEEKKEKKKEQLIIAEQLRDIAIQRRTEAKRLMSVLLARAAETKCQEEAREKMKLEKVKRLKEETRLRDDLILNVQRLEERKLALEKELKMRSRKSSKEKRRRTN